MGEPDRSVDRRPIAVREWQLFQRLAGWLARRGVAPNGISVAGMVCGVAAGGALAATSYLSGVEQRLTWVAAAVLIQLRLLANMLDGMVAIEGRRASPVGELYNEVPDRVSDAATLIGAGYAAGGEIALGYSAACVALLTAYVRAMGKAAGAGQEFCGPMAKQQRMFLVTVVAGYCGLTPHDWQPSWGLATAALGVIIVGGLWTAVRRLWRIALTLRKRTP